MCMYINMYICIHMYTYICVYIYVRVYICSYMYVYIYVHTHTYIYIYTHIFVCVCTYTHICMCEYTDTFVCAREGNIHGQTLLSPQRAREDVHLSLQENNAPCTSIHIPTTCTSMEKHFSLLHLPLFSRAQRMM